MNKKHGDLIVHERKKKKKTRKKWGENRRGKRVMGHLFKSVKGGAGGKERGRAESKKMKRGQRK